MPFINKPLLPRSASYVLDDPTIAAVREKANEQVPPVLAFTWLEKRLRLLIEGMPLCFGVPPEAKDDTRAAYLALSLARVAGHAGLAHGYLVALAYSVKGRESGPAQVHPHVHLLLAKGWPYAIISHMGVYNTVPACLGFEANCWATLGEPEDTYMYSSLRLKALKDR